MSAANNTNSANIQNKTTIPISNILGSFSVFLAFKKPSIINPTHKYTNISIIIIIFIK